MGYDGRVRRSESTGVYSLHYRQRCCPSMRENDDFTFLTNSRTTSRRRTSSASRQSPSTSYVRRHSVTSAYSFDFSISVTLLPLPSFPPTRVCSVVAKRWSRSDDSVDLMRSIRYMPWGGSGQRASVGRGTGTSHKPIAIRL